MGLDFDKVLFPGLEDEEVCICHGNWRDCPLCKGTGRVCPDCGGFGYVLAEEGKAKECSCSGGVSHGTRLPSGLLSGMEVWAFETLRDDPVIREVARKLKVWCREQKGWLLLLAPSGRGKSFFAACLINYARAQGKEAVYFMTSFLLDEIQERRWGRQQFRDWTFTAWWRHLIDVDLLVLDEFGNFNVTDARLEKLRELLISRSDPIFMATVIASDCPFADLEEKFPWLASRFRHQSVKLVDLQGIPDLRRIRD